MANVSPTPEEMRQERYFCARKAGEAFIASTRAPSSEERVRHRLEALRYVQMLRDLSQASPDDGAHYPAARS